MILINFFFVFKQLHVFYMLYMQIIIIIFFSLFFILYFIKKIIIKNINSYIIVEIIHII